ncbi:MAG TPA: GNAT family N-acetyltransferase [Polyangia bacterium]
MIAPEKPAQRESTGLANRPEAGSTEARCRVVVLERPADLDAYLPAWNVLVGHALEPNVFYEPCFLRSALRAFAGLSASGGPSLDLALVLVLGEPEGPPTRTPRNELWGLFPLERRPPEPNLPLSHFRLFQHDYSYLPLPLVHRNYGAQVMAAFFDWLHEQRRCPPLLAIDDLPVGGGVHQLLVDELGRRGATLHVRDRWSRALLAPTCDAETYEATALAGKHRKELRRQRRRLGELGKLEFCVLAPPAPPAPARPHAAEKADPSGTADQRAASESPPTPVANEELENWLGEFMVLEASGWKGRQGTALGSRIPDALFFLEMARACYAAGRLTATAVRLDGKALVMQILLRSGSGAFAFKIGYDEDFARFSPGVLLELDLVERVANHHFLAWIDSAAARNHPMINRLWTERRSIERWLIGLDTTTSLLLATLPAVSWWRQWRKHRRDRNQDPGRDQGQVETTKT